MPGSSDSLVDLIGEPSRDAAPHPLDALPSLDDFADKGFGWRFVAAAIGLSLAAVAAPTAMATLSVAKPAFISPIVLGTLVALLVLAPAAVFMTAGLRGAGWIRAQAKLAPNEIEAALLRLLVYTLLFLYGLAVASENCVFVVAAGLLAAWAMLGAILQWPSAPPLRCHGGLVLDVALFSAFLHFGTAAVAGWYPLYLFLVFYAGLRFGLEALIAGTLAAAAGFAIVVMSTGFWQGQPALAGGLLFALVAVPACLAGTVHALRRAGLRAQAGEVERQTILRLIADTLNVAASGDRHRDLQPGAIGTVGDLAALAAGTFVPPIETFEFRHLLKRTLMPLREAAAQRGVILGWRVDPRLPDRLRGRAQALARILSALCEYASYASTSPTISLKVDAAALDAQTIRLKLRLEGLSVQPRNASEQTATSLRLLERLIQLADGAFTIDRSSRQYVGLTVTLPLTVDAGTVARPLDLDRCPVIIVTEDDELATRLAEPLALWNADTQWRREADAALTVVAARDAAEPAILIVDARDRLLSALSLAHRAVQPGNAAHFTLLIVPPEQIAGLSEMAETTIDALLPAPVSEALLANALDALPLAAAIEARPMTREEREPPIRPPPAQPSRQIAASDDRITPIAAHPKFAAEPSPVVDAKAIGSLQSLGDDPGFLVDLIETFYADAKNIVRRIADAAADADAQDFARGVVALRRAASQLGGTQLCELLASLQKLSGAELRQRGDADVRRISAEVEQFVVALRGLSQSDNARQG